MVSLLIALVAVLAAIVVGVAIVAWLRGPDEDYAADAHNARIIEQRRHIDQVTPRSSTRP